MVSPPKESCYGVLRIFGPLCQYSPMSTICVPAIAAPATVGREAWGDSGEKHLPPAPPAEIGRVRLRRIPNRLRKSHGSTAAEVPLPLSPTLLRLCGGQIVEIPQNNYAKAVTRIPAIFRLEPSEMQCVAIEMGARSVRLVTLQITGGGGYTPAAAESKNYEL